MQLNKIITFIESQRTEQKIQKNVLAGKADITPQYYDLLLKGKSSPNFVVISALLQAIGYDFAVIKTI